VVDKPDRPGEAAACAIGEISRSLPDPGNPSGVRGHVFNVVTDPGYRRRSYVRACVSMLLEWFDQAGIGPVDLHASEASRTLYSELGFADSDAAPM
jgi:ribosomal protein S18 acetylase RimI-like enzyme